VTLPTVSSWSDRLNQANSATSLLMLLYSTSAEERLAVDCFLDFQDKNVCRRNTTYPVPNLRCENRMPNQHHSKPLEKMKGHGVAEHPK